MICNEKESIHLYYGEYCIINESHFYEVATSTIFFNTNDLYTFFMTGSKERLKCNEIFWERSISPDKDLKIPRTRIDDITYVEYCVNCYK